MPFQSLRRTLLALALVMPLSAAHPRTAPAVTPKGGFETSFESYQPLPSDQSPAPGAVDLATIEHTHPDAQEPGAGTPIDGGVASYYGRKFDGRRTASGERFDMTELTAAHRSLPFGTKVRVTNADNGRSVVVRINDRGPFHSGRVIDVSRAAAERLGLIATGSGRVKLTLLED